MHTRLRCHKWSPMRSDQGARWIYQGLEMDSLGNPIRGIDLLISTPLSGRPRHIARAF